MLGALDDALGPEAAAAGGEGITETVLLIGFREITAAAKRAGGKLKRLHALTQRYIVGV